MLVTKQNADMGGWAKVQNQFGERTLDMTGFQNKLVE